MTATGTTVTRMISKAALNPLIAISRLTTSRLSVTTTIDSPKERTTLSSTPSCPKKTRVQAKPGKKKTTANPSIALMTGRRSRKGKAKPNNSLIGDNQSTPCLPFNQHSGRMIYAYSILPNLKSNFKHSPATGQVPALH